MWLNGYLLINNLFKSILLSICKHSSRQVQDGYSLCSKSTFYQSCLSGPNIYYPWSYQKRIACVKYSLQCPRPKFLGQSIKVITHFFEFKFVTVTARSLTYLALNILDCKVCTCTQTFKVYEKVIDLLSSRNRKVKLWVVFKKMHEVLSLKIDKIYPSGMAHWQFLFFSKRVIFTCN